MPNSDQSPDGTFHFWKRAFCLHAGHEWVDDSFVGDGRVCARCGEYDVAMPDWFRSALVAFALGYLLGMAVMLGTLVGRGAI